MGYKVKCFCFQDSPRRALHRGPGRHQRRQGTPERRRQRLSPVLRHGEGRRLPRPWGQRLPLGRAEREHHRPVRGGRRALRGEYGGLLANRSFGGAQVSRTVYARGRTGQQLAPAGAPAGSRRIGPAPWRCTPRNEMLDPMVVVDGKARGIVTRDLKTGEIKPHVADVVVLCRWLRQRLLPVHQRHGQQLHRAARGARTCGALSSRTPATRRFTPRASPRAG